MLKVFLHPAFDKSQMEACLSFVFIFLEEIQTRFADGRGTAVLLRAACLTFHSGWDELEGRKHALVMFAQRVFPRESPSFTSD